MAWTDPLEFPHWDSAGDNESEPPEQIALSGLRETQLSQNGWWNWFLRRVAKMDALLRLLPGPSDTISNTTSLTTFARSGDTYVVSIPADTIRHRYARLRVRAVYTVASTGSPTLSLNLLFASGLQLGFGGISVPASGTIEIVSDLIFETVGNSNTHYSVRRLTSDDTVAPDISVGLAATNTAVPTDTALTITASAQWSAADPSNIAVLRVLEVTLAQGG